MLGAPKNNNSFPIRQCPLSGGTGICLPELRHSFGKHNVGRSSESVANMARIHI